jgi:riboflavin kinase/FMN adenylyltransferase
MKVIFSNGQLKSPIKRAVIAIGVFDGVHLGHQKLIKNAVRRARRINGRSVIITFWPHPFHVLHPEVPLKSLTTLPLRLELIESLGADYCFVIRFTRRFSQQSPQQFIKNYLMKNFNPCEILVGDDFRFGQNRSGNIDLFREEGRKFGFSVKDLISVKAKGKKIGSSVIRQLIQEADLIRASKLLGRRVSVLSTVIRGDGRGRKLGFPTANLNVEHIILPLSGVYAVRVKMRKGKLYEGMANIGIRPSFSASEKKVHFEIHLFNFNKDLYGKEVFVEFVRKIRDEKFFSNTDDLISQLKQDERKARSTLSAQK